MSKILLSNIYVSKWTDTETAIEIILREENIEPLNFTEFIEEKKKINFSCIDDWPSKSEFPCWNCTLNFNGKPWFIPISWTEKVVEVKTKYKISDNFPDAVNKKSQNCVKPFGNFCSPNCAILFLEETSDISKTLKPNYLSLIYLLYEKFTGKKTKYIKPALPKHTLKKFLGPSGLSETEYRKSMVFTNEFY